MEVIPPEYDPLTKERVYRQEWLEYFYFIGWDAAMEEFPDEYAAIFPYGHRYGVRQDENEAASNDHDTHNKESTIEPKVYNTDFEIEGEVPTVTPADEAQLFLTSDDDDDDDKDKDSDDNEDQDENKNSKKSDDSSTTWSEFSSSSSSFAVSSSSSSSSSASVVEASNQSNKQKTLTSEHDNGKVQGPHETSEEIEKRERTHNYLSEQERLHRRHYETASDKEIQNNHHKDQSREYHRHHRHHSENHNYNDNDHSRHRHRRNEEEEYNINKGKRSENYYHRYKENYTDNERYDEDKNKREDHSRHYYNDQYERSRDYDKGKSSAGNNKYHAEYELSKEQDNRKRAPYERDVRRADGYATKRDYDSSYHRSRETRLITKDDVNKAAYASNEEGKMSVNKDRSRREKNRDVYGEHYVFRRERDDFTLDLPSTTSATHHKNELQHGRDVRGKTTQINTNSALSSNNTTRPRNTTTTTAKNAANSVTSIRKSANEVNNNNNNDSMRGKGVKSDRASDERREDARLRRRYDDVGRRRY